MCMSVAIFSSYRSFNIFNEEGVNSSYLIYYYTNMCILHRTIWGINYGSLHLDLFFFPPSQKKSMLLVKLHHVIFRLECQNTLIYLCIDIYLSVWGNECLVLTGLKRTNRCNDVDEYDLKEYVKMNSMNKWIIHIIENYLNWTFTISTSKKSLNKKKLLLSSNIISK